PGAAARLDGDRLLALNLLGRHREVIARVDARAGAGLPLPAWLRVTVADSYMARQEPEHAAGLLQAVVDEDRSASTATVLLAYAWLELERHDDARRLLADWRRAQPPFDADGRAYWPHAAVDLNSV